MEFKEIQNAIKERMQSEKIHSEVIEDYTKKVQKIFNGYSGKISWDNIGDLEDTDYAKLEELPEPTDLKSDIQQLVMIKLNGGLGTSMGLSKAKSLISVKENKNFIGIIKDQILDLRKEHSAPVPLLFMNSFNTSEDTLQEPGIRNLNSSLSSDFPADFLQNMVPRIKQDTLLPAWDGKSSSHWCPPGHGDIFLSLKIRGILDKLLAKGLKYAFISNGDNLGAIFDERILSYFIKENLDFISEVTPKTKADLKGGVLYRIINDDKSKGPIELLETAQVEDKHIPDFQDVKRFSYFNINNLWVNLESLRDRMSDGAFELSLIRNPKEVDGLKVLQLETAMGSAIGRFDNTRVLIVPRSRFAPVKTCADLLVRRSDIYILRDEDEALIKNPKREEGEPVVILDSNYKKIQEFESFFRHIPSMIDMTRFEVTGPVLFDQKIILKGEVKIINKSKEAHSISEIQKTTFENETVEF